MSPSPQLHGGFNPRATKDWKIHLDYTTDNDTASHAEVAEPARCHEGNEKTFRYL
jgi:hypothetical protein